MKEYKFICTLLSEVVLSSSSATAGFRQSLDYIPGAKFLGILAGNNRYAESNEQTTLDLFHNGKVRYGDAHPFINKVRCIKSPFSWYIPKGDKVDDNKIYLQAKITELPEEVFAEEQPKQVRAGYFNAVGDFLNIPQNFSVKSAYDRELRRAKDEQMYGYYSLPKGSEWSFSVYDEEDKYGEIIVTALEGTHRIGRSRSAEYGLVEIKKVEEVKTVIKNDFYIGEIFIYAASNLCFYDTYGKTTLLPTVEQLGLEGKGKVVIEKTQIRSRLYQTWNRKRFNRDADRMIIEKGSVICVQLTEKIPAAVFANGLGNHQAEGFGEVLINPHFLQSDTPLLKSKNFKKIDVAEWIKPTVSAVFKTGVNDTVVLKFLKCKKSKKKR